MFAYPLGLLGLLAVPAVLLLHLFRRRFRPRVVAATFLWRTREHVPLAGRRRTPPLRTPSLWLELLAALCLGLALGGPRACGAGEAVHLVAVLDDSASMAARMPGADSVAEEAARELRRRIDAAPARSRVSVVLSGRKPRLLAGPAAFPREAAAALEAWDPRAPRHELAPAVALAQQLAGDGTVLVLTDRHEPERFPVEVEVVALGRPLENVALTHATRARRAEATGEQVFLTAAHLGRRPARARLTLRSLPYGVELASELLELEPGERRHATFDLAAGAGPVEARLTAPDGSALEGLSIDDRVALAPVPRRTLALATTLDRATCERLRLAGRAAGASAIERLLALVPDAVEAPAPDLAHLVLAAEEPAAAPSPAPGEAPWPLVIAAPGRERADLVGPFLVDRGHPLADGLTLDGAVWSAAPDARLPGTPVVSAGNLALLTEEDAGPLAGAAERRVLRANLDPRRSTLQDTADWPILLANLAELRRAELPGPRRANLAVGERYVWRHAGPGTYTVAGEGRTTTHEARGDLELEAPDRPGLYTVRRGDEPLGTFGVAFSDAAESDLRGASAGRRAAEGTRATVLAGFTWIEMLLLLAVGVCVVLDWWVLARAARAASPAHEGAAGTGT